MRKMMVFLFICSILSAGVAPVEMEWTRLMLKVTTMEQVQVNDILKKALLALQYDDSYTVGDHLMFHYGTEESITRFIRDHTMIKQNFLTDGGTEYVYELHIADEILDILMPAQHAVRFVVPMLCPCCGQVWPNTVPVPDDIALIPRQIEASGHTGLIIDCRGKALNPCLFPRIVTEDGDEVYSVHFAYRHKVIEEGLVQYASNEGSLPSRVGSNPLLIEAEDVVGNRRADIIITKKDALRIHGSKELVQSLKECRVVIIFGP